MKRCIGIIIDPYEEREPSGLAYVTAEYLRGLLERAPQYDYLVYTKEPFKLFPLPKNATNVIISKSLLGKNWYFLKEFFLNRKGFPDMLVFNMPLLPLLLPKSVTTAIYCHEVLYEPDTTKTLQRLMHGVWRMLAYHTVRHARLIFSATHATAAEVSETYRVSLETIHVVPHGIRPVPKTILEQTLFNHPYFLFVGRTKYKKNMHGIVEGFLRFKEQTGAPHLLCLAGRTKDTPYLMGLLTEAEGRGFGEAIIRTGYLPEDQLLAVFKGATGFLFCSLAEGFGLPIPEAMSVGVPVITSDIPVLAEVAGGAALLVDPYDPATIADAMEKIAVNPETRLKLIEKGFQQAEKYQWSTAQEAFVREITNVLG